MNTKYLTSKQVASLLGIQHIAVTRLARGNKIKYYKPGKSYLFDPKDVEVYIKGE